MDFEMLPFLCRFYRAEILGLSQVEFSDLSGIPQPHISAHESGKIAKRCTEAYLEMGLNEWLASMGKKEFSVISDIYSHAWAKRLHNKFPDKVPVRREWRIE